MCSIIVGYKNRWSYSHPKTLGKINHGILGTCGNQYCTSILAVIMAHFVIGSMLCLFTVVLMCKSFSFKYPESDESDESNEEESDELGPKSGSFGTCGYFCGELLSGVSFDLGVTHVGGDCWFRGGGGCSVDCVHNDDKLLCARDVVVENVLTRAVVEVLLGHIS